MRGTAVVVGQMLLIVVVIGRAERPRHKASATSAESFQSPIKLRGNVANPVRRLRSSETQRPRLAVTQSIYDLLSVSAVKCLLGADGPNRISSFGADRGIVPPSDGASIVSRR